MLTVGAQTLVYLDRGFPQNVCLSFFLLTAESADNSSLQLFTPHPSHNKYELGKNDGWSGGEMRYCIFLCARNLKELQGINDRQKKEKTIRAWKLDQKGAFIILIDGSLTIFFPEIFFFSFAAITMATEQQKVAWMVCSCSV